MAVISGNDADNTLTGGNGGDTIDGLFGGGGNDRLLGGNGIDLLSGDDGSDTLLGGDAGDTIDGAAGTDLADYAFSTLGVFADLRLTGPQPGIGDGFNKTLIGIENLGGSQLGDELSGDSGENLVFGRGGGDTVVVTDFADDDVLALPAALGPDAAAIIAQLVQNGSDAVLALAAGHAITLSGASIGR